MSKKKSKATTLKKAKPTMRKPKGDVAKITLARNTTTAMKGSSLWAGSPDLQAANAGWNKASDALEKNAGLIEETRTQLATLEAAQVGLRHDWAVAADHMTGVVSVVAAGDPGLVAALGYGVKSYAALGPLPAPDGLKAEHGKASGEAVFTWIRGAAHRGFIVQHASDVANQATYSAPKPCTKTKYTLKGVTAPVYFRIAAIDPSVSEGESPWTAWISGSVG